MAPHQHQLNARMQAFIKENGMPDRLWRRPVSPDGDEVLEPSP